MGIMIFRESPIPETLHQSKTYYLVDYDFQDPNDPERQRFYSKVRKLLGGLISEHTSTTSVIITPDKPLAIKIAKLAKEHGGIAHVREARSIEA